MKLEAIYKLVFDYYNIDYNIDHKKRDTILVKPRQMYFLLAKKHTSYTLYQIGLELNKDHSTVSTGIKTITNLIETEKQMKFDYDTLDAKVTSLNRKKIKSIKKRYNIDQILLLIELWKDEVVRDEFKEFYNKLKKS